MTFRQALNVVWRKRLLILIVIVLAMAVAVVFLIRQVPVYTSTISVRMSSLAATASASGQIGTATVDFNPETVTSASVLDPAAKKLGESAASTASWEVAYALVQGATTSQAVAFTITANGSSAEQAQQHATAVADSYNAYLTKQMALARKAAESQVTTWTAQAESAQAAVDKNPTDSIAQSSLSSAITSLSNANTTISTIDSAGAPLLVTKPATVGDFQGTSPLIALLVALAAGLVAGIGVALIWDAFDDRLRDDEDVEALTGVPLLGELSMDKGVRRGRERLPAAGRARTTLNEGLRSLRTTLQVLLPAGSDVVVVTSVEPGDGKTFISSNLALAWARMGRRVVLIGGDLRKAGLEERFGDAATGPGLTELLQGASLSGSAPTPAAVADVLRETPYPGLEILPSGEEPWDPADLLALDALGDIVAALRELCDVIIIDSPPSLALVDARLIAAHADGVVVVSAMRRTRRKQLTATVHALTASGASVLGVVANQSRRVIPSSYSEYYGTGHRHVSDTRNPDGGPHVDPVEEDVVEPVEATDPDEITEPDDTAETTEAEAGIPVRTKVRTPAPSEDEKV